ncbi:hypothetical protein B7463_g540, partial [Scytalidium lignicola]
MDHLPPLIKAESINALMESISMPKPLSIISPKVSACYHGIYMITIPFTNGKSELVLRVSGSHIPKIKTENEAAIMSWVSKNSAIPIPEVIAYDSSTNNPINHEYIILSRARGETLSEIYQSLGNEKMISIIDQLIDILHQLHAVDWNYIGGLKFNETGEIVPGPVLEENFWYPPDIQQFWPPGETMSTLNIEGPYPTYVDYISAHIQRYIHGIEVHEKLAFMRDTLSRLKALVNALANNAEKLNNVKLKLAHKDLHFSNILYDQSSSRITAILDWEFSGIVPFTRWNPTRAFLWNARDDADSGAEKERLLSIFKERCKERNVEILEDAQYSSTLQEAMQTAANFLRAIVEVVPRGQKGDLVRSWKDILLKQLEVFGV